VGADLGCPFVEAGRPAAEPTVASNAGADATADSLGSGKPVVPASPAAGSSPGTPFSEADVSIFPTSGPGRVG
jgi:hypothetical protein